jgi:hypothetical protein
MKGLGKIQLLPSLYRPIGLNKRVHGEVTANQGKQRHNHQVFMVCQVVPMILLIQISDAKARKQHKHQPGKLEPEGVKGPAQRNHQGFAPGENRVKKAVFLYNSLERIFDIGNFRHFAYCSAKIGVSFVGA